MHPSIGARFDSTGKCCFTLWAPQAQQVSLLLEDQAPLDLKALSHGYWQITLDQIEPGSRYRYQIDQGPALPDPASRYQPEGVHGPSAVVKPEAFDWQDDHWIGLPQEQWIIYELHVGTFTPAGTFEAAIERLDELVDLGITVVELMPIAQFPGGRNWGYDGVYPFAAQASYGGPVGLMALVDACHERGLAIILDVVYNHQGPEGNYLSQFGPYFTDRYRTPWGQAINFDGPYSDGVRHYYLENALMWLKEFHLDGFRLDAVHAIRDAGAKHFLAELTERVQHLREETGRFYTLIAECDLNDRRYLEVPALNGFGLHGQWIDEFHHCIHALLTGEQVGYYEDFGTLSLLAKAYNDAYVYDGIYSHHRKRVFGSKAKDLKGQRFVAFIQNHDQIGNRMRGERWSHLVDFETQKLAVAMLFVSPYLPLLFMGEEYGETNAFTYFVSHGDEGLIEAVRQGRKEEFQAFFPGETVPDPQELKWFEQSKLNWDWSDSQARTLRAYYKQWISWKKAHPVLSDHDRSLSRAWADEAKQVLYLLRGDAEHQLLCWMNVSQQPQTVTWSENRGGELVLNSAAKVWGGPGPELPPNINPAEPLTLAPRSVAVFELMSG